MDDADTIARLTSLPYHEPSLVTVLVLSSFLLFVNFARVIAGRAIGAGLLGEILIGAVYAAPLSSILPASVQYSLQSYGYLGLMLLIVEGGLNTRLDILTQRSTALLAICTASVGIILPIGFSFALLPPAFGFGWIESFACGAALASTSLGTVFSVIASTNSNMAVKDANDQSRAQVDSQPQDQSIKKDDVRPSLADTRVGTVLVGAALLDDIVGLVFSSVVTNLSSGQPGVTRLLAPWTAARPVVASTCLLLVSSLLVRWVLSPLLRCHGKAAAQALLRHREHRRIAPWLSGISLSIFIAIISAFASIASYIGSSNLIGCFCAGAFMSYTWQILESTCGGNSDKDQKIISSFSPHTSLEAIMPVGTYVLIPFFFASIGAAIPIKEMFVASIVWKGFIYTGLMGIAKALAGGCLSMAGLRHSISPSQKPHNISTPPAAVQGNLTELPTVRSALPQELIVSPRSHSLTSARLTASWPAALFLGVCLVARGEIGFLIINLAYQGGLVEQEAFLVSVWAITLNTVIGPASIGIFLRTDVGRSIERGRWGRIDKITHFPA